MQKVPLASARRRDSIESVPKGNPLKQTDRARANQSTSPLVNQAARRESEKKNGRKVGATENYLTLTQAAKKVGFTARPVVGGVFAQLLYDKAVWKKWASRDKTKASGWAPIPPLVRSP